MGTCGSNTVNSKKNITVKIKSLRKKRNKIKNKIQNIDFEIYDTITKKTNYQKSIKNNLTLSELLTLADYNVFGDLDIQLNDNTNITSELNSNIKDIIEAYFPNENLLTVNLLVTTKGLSIPSNIRKAYQDMTPIIGNAIFENPKMFGIILYFKENSNLETYYFDKEIYKELTKFNSFSSYCSARGIFFISGGEKDEEIDIQKETEEYNDFISIDMKKLNFYNLYLDALPNLIEKRTWHSMIFVPNQYIFIVGGLNTKTVEIYDIDKNEIYLDSELNKKRCEPTMCLVNNIYLYAFCGFSPFDNFNDSIERCNLLKKKREWEFIDYTHNITPSFFGVSYLEKEDNNIILISSKDNYDDENKSYTVRIEKDEDCPDEMNEIKINYNEVRTFKDKLFYPVYDNTAINMPLIVGENKHVLILDIHTGNIECKIFKE